MYSSPVARLPLPVLLLCALCAGAMPLVACDDKVNGNIGDGEDHGPAVVDPDRKDNQPPTEMGRPDAQPDMAPDMAPDAQPGEQPDVQFDTGGSNLREDIGPPEAGVIDRGIDEGAPCAPMATRACDLACGDGFQTCLDGAWGECEPLPEICNGRDDDCDGASDEGFAPGEVCEAGVGECRREGAVVCTADGAARCDAVAGPVEEEGCNQRDDDCDGIIDEDFGGGAPCVLGLGRCAVPSVEVCIDERIVCFGEADEPGPEGCNGWDDDCDGAVDEDFTVGVACEVGLGPCRATGMWICDESGDALCLADDAAEPVAELCNGVDDDCDGAVDEGTVDPAVGGDGPCFEGVGECRVEGQVICDEAGELRCSAVPGPPVDELCNGLDEDCDGAVDEGYRLGSPCGAGAGACERLGTRICGPDGRATCSAEEGQPGIERCNDIDDDCDGEADEGFELDVRCEIGVGACLTGGRTICAADGEGVRCDADGPAPSDERCNGMDDDCDGEEDEGFAVGAPCVGGEGVCAREGRFDCVADGSAECAAIPGEPAFERCDGADEDCDGAVDEGLGLGGPCSEGIGACERPGVLICADDGETRCDAEPGPVAAERCNAIDDDCDGIVDDGIEWQGIPLGGACSEGIGQCQGAGVVVCDDDDEADCSAEEGEPALELCNGLDDDCDGRSDEGFGLGDGCQVGVGACLELGQRACDRDGGVKCTADAGLPSPERCNSVDDDCDGGVDEGLALDGIPLGGRCELGVGRCLAGGEVVCGDGVALCDAEPGAPRPELCNGVDEDCDGVADEVFDLDAGCTEGIGACARDGVVICGDDGGAACTATAGAARNELCDGADDDCDGAIDEDYALGRACTAGLGACAAIGVTVCGPDGRDAPCGAQPGPASDEICNGIDDDCDGAVDEGLGLGDPCAVGLGACRVEGEQICADDASVSCSVDPGQPAPAEICGGRDADCDGAVDEGFRLGEGCVSGLGICAADGVRVCAADGGATCDGVPGAPEAEACNDLDDDCDGIVDEGEGDQAGVAFGLCGPRYRSCLDALHAGGVASGVYRISSENSAGSEVYCDQTTDGGGWALVMATATPPTDGIGPWHDELLDKYPQGGHDGVWAGLSHLGDRPFDLRFACRGQDAGGVNRQLDVDVAFYGTPWYRQFIRGGEAASCFATIADDPVLPARRDLIGGGVRAHGQPYPLANGSRLIGEPACASPDIMLVDFDDGGVLGAGADGTDWGSAGGRGVCGSVVENGQWLVFAREDVPHPLGPIGLINLPGLEDPIEAAGFEAVPLAVDDPGLAAALDPAIVPAVFIGRYAQDWPSVPAGLEDIMGCYTFSGGSVVTEFDGFSLLGPRYAANFVYREDAPDPWGWLSAVTGGGQALGEGTPVEILDLADPITRGLGERFRAGGGTERFISIGQVHPSVPIPLDVLASFAGDGDGFPDDAYPALAKGNQCGGNLLVGAFDYADAPRHPSIVRLVGNLAAAAVSPPEDGLVEFCDGGLGQDRCE